MKIQYVIIELKKLANTTLNHFASEKRISLLLKGNVGDDIGFVEYTPWPSLGQTSINQIIKDLKTHPNHFLKQKIKKDATSWQNLADQSLPDFKNHSFFFEGKKLLISSNKVKVKISGNVKKDLVYIKENCKAFSSIRMDANFRYSKDDFQTLCHALKNENYAIDYIEDPTPWEFNQYRNYVNQKLPIAIDQPYNTNLTGRKLHCPYIIKPSMQFLKNKNSENVFSSNFGHPLGLWQDYCQLLEHGNINLTHGIYAPDMYDSWNAPFYIHQNNVRICKTIVKRNYKKLKELIWNDI